MEILGRNGKLRPPTCAAEYFSVLFCNRKKIVCRQNSQPGMKAWNSLSPVEQKMFVDKFEKWQGENNKKITSILEHAEPFLKKKTTKEKGNIPSSMKTIQEDCDVSLPGSTLNISTNSHSYIQSNADLEVSKREDLNVEFYMDDYDDQSESMINLVYDDTPTGNLEVPKQFYTASVIDEDIDKPTAPETNEAITKTALPEPTLPTVMRPKELFEIIKASGARPELATVEWKNMSNKEKYMYIRATRNIQKDYLKNYEQYLESLSSPDLFKHYIKFKKEN
ncbi:uncharacterized protein LOC134755918 [Cydia strobilella]|uniref:uncharacterized protein LOC134755918 n=1 Tax=Cydia strobilella TaxID=1100964 RepID=UPI003005F262